MTTADVPYKFLSTAESPPRQRDQTVTDQLRRAIVSLEIEPGAVLDKGAICERLGVSRFPVSEALARLAAGTGRNPAAARLARHQRCGSPTWSRTC